MIIYKDKLTKDKGYYEGNLGAVDQSTASIPSEYKKNICRNFISINQGQVISRIAGDEFYITRKVDGEMNVIFYNGEEAFLINSGGKVRFGLPCIEEAFIALKKAGIKSAIIPAELYVSEEQGRTRVFDVLSALSKENEIDKLCLAPFDVLEIDESNYRSKTYEEKYKKLEELFGNVKCLKPPRYSKASSKQDVLEIYSTWVENEGSEGIIVRSPLPLVYKVKPKHNVDVAIVGFTEGSAESKGHIRTLLLALMTEENQYQVVGRTGNGFGEELKKELFEKLSSSVIDSDYIETDSNHAAFRMVKPSIVIEVSYNDVLFETSTSRISNPILSIDDDKYKLISCCNGISFIYPIFERIRDDKTVNHHDVRLSQVTDLIYVPDFKAQAGGEDSPASEILHREVYKKESKGKLMVQKFMVWKTNKEDADDRYPAYVMHYTNFSSDRKEPLQREVRISNSKDQIFEIFKQYMEDNVKKGWVKV